MLTQNPVNPRINHYSTPIDISATIAIATTKQLLSGYNPFRTELIVTNNSTTPNEDIIISYRSSPSDAFVRIPQIIKPSSTTVLSFYINRDNYIGDGEYSIESTTGTPAFIAIEY